LKINLIDNIGNMILEIVWRIILDLLTFIFSMTKQVVRLHVDWEFLKFLLLLSLL